MDINVLVIILIVSLAASILSNWAGHGGAMILLPVLALWFEPVHVIGLAVFYYLTMNISRVYAFRSGIEWWAIFALTPVAIPAALLGIWAIDVIDSPRWMRMAIGIFVLVFVVNEWFKPEKIHHIRQRYVPLILVGIPYGFLSGFISSGSIVRTPVMIRLGFTKEHFIATTSLSSLFVNIPKIYWYGQYGFLELASPLVVSLLCAGAVVGTYIGKRLQKRVSSESFHIYVLLMLGILGCWQIWAALK